MSDYDVIIAGAGPAGSAAAIHLALSGFEVLLLEKQIFPRPKLCGEFISPECQRHFEKLGVARAMELASPATLTRTSFYGRKGQYVEVPSSSFGGVAFGLSRATMDHNLLERARHVGVRVLENATVTELLRDGSRVIGLKYRSGDSLSEATAKIAIDATGRGRVLCRKVIEHKADVKRSKMIAFKAHFKKTDVEAGTCEIYVYRGGYGGLSSVGGDIANLCFIVTAKDVQRCNSDADKVLTEIVMKNRRASTTLTNAVRYSEWLSASWQGFGRFDPSPATGLLAIGDSAAFIDPFTGSGMLMALDTAEMVSRTIVRYRNKLGSENSLKALSGSYAHEYSRKFSSRLRLCSFLRRAAFSPVLAESVIALCNNSTRLKTILAKATRGPGDHHKVMRTITQKS
jgi:flavin-dependent dehydrogenase